MAKKEKIHLEKVENESPEREIVKKNEEMLCQILKLESEICSLSTQLRVTASGLKTQMTIVDKLREENKTQSEKIDALRIEAESYKTEVETPHKAIWEMLKQC
jgi:hypothetical protein